MTVPKSGQTVHMMDRRGVLRVLWDMRRKEGRNVRELEFYTTDDLRRLYQTETADLIQLRDGIVSRVQVAAVVWWERFGNFVLLSVSMIGRLPPSRARHSRSWRGGSQFHRRGSQGARRTGGTAAQPCRSGAGPAPRDSTQASRVGSADHANRSSESSPRPKVIP
jgi:hypothetical protein